MKQTKIIAFLVLAFIFGIAAPVAGITIAHNVAAEEATAITVSTETELRNAILEGTTSIILASDINLTSRLNIERTGSLTIDLNNHKITANNNVKNVIVIKQGNITFAGTGSIETQRTTITVEGSDQPAAQNYSVLTVGSGVTIKSTGWYGIAIDIYKANSGGKGKASYGVQINCNGTIIAPYGLAIHGDVQNLDNAPLINIGSSAIINASTSTYEDATPIYAAGVGNWNVQAATLSGHAAIGTKAGRMTFNNTNVQIDGTMTTPPQPASGKINGYSSVFQIEHYSPYADGVELTINGGNYVSQNAEVFYEYNLVASDQTQADIDINGGTFTAAPNKPIFGGDVADMDIRISGGSFSGSDVSSFAANGYLAPGFTIDENGVVQAPSSKPTTGSSASTTTTSELTSADGAVTVRGNLHNAVTLKAELVNKYIADFGKRKSIIYNLELLDVNGRPVQLTAPVTVSIKVPTDFDGKQTGAYYINNDDDAKQLDSAYGAGIISFETDHFSVYALVDNTAVIFSDSDQRVPNTGSISDQGIITAIATTAPLMIIAGIAFVCFNRHMIKIRRAENQAAAERERIAKAYIPKAKKEATIDHFVAIPMEHKNPTGPMVDVFMTSGK